MDIETQHNILPFDGIVNYYGQLWTEEQADFYLNKLLETIDWRNEELVMFGKRIIAKRKVG